jgi:DNA polymerase V
VSRVQKIDIPIATNNTLELVNLCAKALEHIYIKGYFYSKAGVIFSELKPKDHYEKNLFSDQNLNLDHLMKVIDQTNSKFGRGAVTVAAARLSNNSQMKRRYSSKIDTSFIKLAPTVRAH